MRRSVAERGTWIAATSILMAAAAGPGGAQTGVSPGQGDLTEPARIYSPYVERTVSDRNFADGLYT